MNSDEQNEIGSRLIRAARQDRGYASFFDYPDKDTKEWRVCSALFEAMKKQGVKSLGIPDSLGKGSDPPDCQLQTLDNKLIGIEATELVCGKSIQKSKANELIFDNPWNQERLHTTLTERINSKDKAQIKGGPYDSYFLLIYTDEPDLNKYSLSNLLEGWSPPKTQLIDKIYLLLSYDPQLDTCPYFEFDCCKTVY